MSFRNVMSVLNMNAQSGSFQDVAGRTIEIATVNGGNVQQVAEALSECVGNLTQLATNFASNATNTIIEGASLCVGRDPYWYMNWRVSTTNEVAAYSNATLACIENRTNAQFQPNDEECPEGTLDGQTFIPLVSTGFALTVAAITAVTTGLAVWNHMQKKRAQQSHNLFSVLDEQTNSSVNTNNPFETDALLNETVDNTPRAGM